MPDWSSTPGVSLVTLSHLHLQDLPSLCAASPCLSLHCSGQAAGYLLFIQDNCACCCRFRTGKLWCDASKQLHEQWALLLPHDLETLSQRGFAYPMT
jgi:hypothetical protein